MRLWARLFPNASSRLVTKVTSGHNGNICLARSLVARTFLRWTIASELALDAGDSRNAALM